MVSQVEGCGHDDQDNVVMVAVNNADMGMDEELFVDEISSFNVSVKDMNKEMKTEMTEVKTEMTNSNIKDMNKEMKTEMTNTDIKDIQKEDENFLFKNEIGNNIWESRFNLNVDGVLENLLDAARNARTKKVVDKGDLKERLEKNILLLDNLSNQCAGNNWSIDEKLLKIRSIKGLLEKTLDKLELNDMDYVINFLNARKRIIIDQESENKPLFNDLLQLGIKLFDVVNENKRNGYLGLVQVKLRLGEHVTDSDLNDLRQLANGKCVMPQPGVETLHSVCTGCHKKWKKVITYFDAKLGSNCSFLHIIFEVTLLHLFL